MTKFKLGRVVITAAAQDVVAATDYAVGLTRHQNGDWGNLEPEDKEANDLALEQGDRLLSSYKTEKGVTYWIITEWDRSVTTILLPSDY